MSDLLITLNIFSHNGLVNAISIANEIKIIDILYDLSILVKVHIKTSNHNNIKIHVVILKPLKRQLPLFI